MSYNAYMQMKKCSKCKIIKPASEFYPCKSRKIGICSSCKECCRAAKKEYYSNNAEKIKKIGRENYKEHTELIKSRRKEYYYSNKEKCLECNRKYAATHKDRINKNNRKRYANLSTDKKIFAQLKSSLNRRIRTIILIDSLDRLRAPEQIIELTGLVPQELRKILLDGWRKRYSTAWQGEPFHIDHIIPTKTANTIHELKKLYNYRNLQMLKPNDNAKKGTSTTL